MNRAERRAQNTERRKVVPVESYRVRAGRCALTLDVAGFAPTTLEIDEGRLTDAVKGTDELAAGRTYSQILGLFGAAFRHMKAGHADAVDACLFGWWLAFNHPAGGAAMVDTVSGMMAAGERVHVTLNISAAGGLTIAVSGQFVDLDRVSAEAKASNLGISVFNLAPDRVRETRQ
jgi:hypothetical protein